MPLAERRWLDSRRGQLVSPTVVVVQPQVALQGVGTHDIVVSCGEAKHEAPRGIASPCYRLKADGSIHIGVWCGRRDNHVEEVLHRALHQNPLTTRRSAHLFDGPLAGNGLPTRQAWWREIEMLHGCLRGHREVGRVCWCAASDHPYPDGERRCEHQSQLLRHGDSPPLLAVHGCTSMPLVRCEHTMGTSAVG